MKISGKLNGCTWLVQGCVSLTIRKVMGVGLRVTCNNFCTQESVMHNFFFLWVIGPFFLHTWVPRIDFLSFVLA